MRGQIGSVQLAYPSVPSIATTGSSTRQVFFYGQAPRKTLRQYHTYLTANLEFPFTAEVEDLDGEATMHSLFALNDCPDLTFYGLFVRGNQGRRLIEIPLATIEEVKDEGTNKQLIEDYCLWFWNYR
jgi:Calcium binding